MGAEGDAKIWPPIVAVNAFYWMFARRDCDPSEANAICVVLKPKLVAFRVKLDQIRAKFGQNPSPKVQSRGHQMAVVANLPFVVAGDSLNYN